MSTSPQSGSLTEVLSRLDQLTNWERRPRGEMRVGLEPMLDLMERLGNPHRSFRAIHVAGTKGKGSVCALAEAGLMHAGLRVGRYGSPHVTRVNERVSILGEPISDDGLAKVLTLALDGYEAARRDGTAGEDATWFDIITTAAFLAFREAAVEWAVVEVGLGGRLDSTNVVDGEVAVVTNIELEHTEILGSTREAIAREKVGILKPGAVLVTALPADDAAGRVVQQRADELGCPVLRTTFTADATIADRNSELVGLVFDWLGEHGERSRGQQGDAGAPIGAWLLDGAVRDRARLPGRMERASFRGTAGSGWTGLAVPVVLDGAHVPFNIEAVMNDLVRSAHDSGPCIAVVALASDKDAQGFLSVLSHHVSKVICTETPGIVKGHAATELQGLATSMALPSEAIPDAPAALERAASLAAEAGGWVLVTGSLYLVGALRGAMQRDQAS